VHIANSLPKTLIALLQERAQAHPNRPLFSFLDRNGEIVEAVTIGQLFNRACAVAAMLQSAELQELPLVLWYSHDFRFIEAFFGTILAGSIAMPLARPRGRGWNIVEEILADSGARVVLTVSSMAERFPAFLVQKYSLRILCTDTVQADMADRWVSADIAPSNPAFVQYTSGSVSKPRGVVISHANVLHNLGSVKKRLDLTSSDIGVSWLPFFHDMGLINHVIQPLYSTIHNYHLTPSQFASKPGRWLEAISRYRGTLSGGPNFAYDLCCAEIDVGSKLELSSWRIAYAGSEKISLATMRIFKERFGPVGFSEAAFFPCYGLAESTLFVCGTNNCHALQLESTGLNYVRVGDLSDIESIIIVDSVKGTWIRTENTVGEIWIKSASVASGYFKNGELSSTTFASTCEAGSGYLRTGDLGFIHRRGLYFTGRLRNLMKIRGRAFFAEDIESHVAGTGEKIGVVRCAAFSIDINRAEVLIVLIETDSKSDGSVTEESIRAAVCDKFDLNPFAVRILERNVLPLTTSGKVQRTKCRANFIAGDYG
jgi:acyl-CoA synthetase (AMP-forming)/AMP-acid ligase II